MGGSGRLATLSRQIFGSLPITNVRTGNKILRRCLKGPKVVDWWHKPISAFDNKLTDYNELRLEDRNTKLDKLRRRGKAPPKKGHGKRSAKKK